MTERDLDGLRYIKARIVKLEERQRELEMENGVGAINMDGMPHSSNPGNPVERMAIARAALQEKLAEAKAAAVEKELEIRQFIESVELEDVKLIIELRFIRLMDWYDIAVELSEITGKYVDRTTPAKKMRKYLKEHG